MSKSLHDLVNPGLIGEVVEYRGKRSPLYIKGVVDHVAMLADDLDVTYKLSFIGLDLPLIIEEGDAMEVSDW